MKNAFESQLNVQSAVSDQDNIRIQKMLQISPVQYLLKYRVMQGAEMLLANPAGSISETASYCGFDSPSHFAKMFKRFYNCTPREYRQLNAV
ncbi:MAG TPA: helix-turn-helix domain-containing protein [Candidatus Lachnoclostridium pullistercoris]|uniref:Helix-turn-helix domain-containing protein n=1 Tax=Candidatus Lachnoclostridium pullistercoris TaxID=2838632 RepID=A0A9D2T5M9_9FIRM|nr:helix-turn-helix domain-containing protein [Candidatus Lachnoclostridium pullistercoris]